MFMHLYIWVYVYVCMRTRVRAGGSPILDLGRWAPQAVVGLAQVVGPESKPAYVRVAYSVA